MIASTDLIGVGEPWTRVHRRVFDTPGDIVDLGCLTWDWSKRFFGHKRVIGVDPFETENPPPPFESIRDAGAPLSALWRGVISAVRGGVFITNAGSGSSTRYANSGVSVDAMTLADLLFHYQIERVACLKINVEGSEYEILPTLTEATLERIDQIAVSFHDFIGLGSYKATAAILGFLGNWYDVMPIDPRYSWYLCVRRR